MLRLAIEQYTQQTLRQGTFSDRKNVESEYFLIAQEVSRGDNEDGTESKDIALSALLVIDEDGNSVTRDDIVSGYNTSNGGLNDYSVFAVHTSYFSFKSGSLGNLESVRLTRMETELIYGSQLTAGKLTQYYIENKEPVIISPIQKEKVTTLPLAGRVYTYYPGGNYCSTNILDAFITSGAKINVGNTYFVVEYTADLYYFAMES